MSNDAWFPLLFEKAAAKDYMRILHQTSGSQPGVPGPLGVRNKIFGFPKCDLRVRVCMLLDVLLSKQPRFMKFCSCYYSKQHHPA